MGAERVRKTAGWLAGILLVVSARHVTPLNVVGVLGLAKPILPL